MDSLILSSNRYCNTYTIKFSDVFLHVEELFNLFPDIYGGAFVLDSMSGCVGGIHFDPSVELHILSFSSLLSVEEASHDEVLFRVFVPFCNSSSPIIFVFEVLKI